MEEVKSTVPLPSRKGRRLTRLAILLVALGVLVGVLPRIAAVTPLRDVVLKRFLKNWPGPATAESATLGWFTPVAFTNIHMISRDSDTQIDIPHFRAEAPLWRFVFTKQNLGLIRIESPVAEVIVLPRRQSSVPIPETKEVAETTARRRDPVGVEIEINDLTVRLRGTEEVDWTTINDVSLAVELTIAASGDQVVEVAPGRILDHVEITPIMGEAGLMYIAPVLADLAWAKGQFSLELDACKFNLAHPEVGELKGRLAIHAVEAGGKNAVVKEVGQTLMTLFPKKMPQAIKFMDNSVIEFVMADQGIRHDGLAFGLPALSPDLVIEMDGWVGFDQSLDLIAEIPIPVYLFQKDRPPGSPGGESFELPIGGTIGQPKVDFAAGGRSGMEMVDRLLDRLPKDDPAATQAADVIRAFGAALKERAADDPNGTPVGQKIIENGLPKVGRFAEQVLKGEKRKERRNANGDTKEAKPRRNGPLKGLFRRNPQKANDNPPAPAAPRPDPTGPI